MTQKFVNYQTMVSYLVRNPNATAQEAIETLATKAQTIVCGVDVDDIYELDFDVNDLTPDLTPDQQEAVLELYQRRFDWTACHQDLQDAVDTIRRGE